MRAFIVRVIPIFRTRDRGRPAEHGKKNNGSVSPAGYRGHGPGLETIHMLMVDARTARCPVLYTSSRYFAPALESHLRPWNTSLVRSIAVIPSFVSVRIQAQPHRAHPIPNKNIPINTNVPFSAIVMKCSAGRPRSRSRSAACSASISSACLCCAGSSW